MCSTASTRAPNDPTPHSPDHDDALADQVGPLPQRAVGPSTSRSPSWPYHLRRQRFLGDGLGAISLRSALKAESKIPEKLGHGWMIPLSTSSGMRARMVSVGCWIHSPAPPPEDVSTCQPGAVAEQSHETRSTPRGVGERRGRRLVREQRRGLYCTDGGRLRALYVAVPGVARAKDRLGGPDMRRPIAGRGLTATPIVRTDRPRCAPTHVVWIDDNAAEAGA